MIEENYRLVYSILTKYFKGYKNKEDLFQAGCIGLINAYNNYKEEFNTKFSTYAYTYILGEMRKCIYKDTTIKMNIDMQKCRNKVLQAYNGLSQKLQRTPTTLELSTFLEMDEQLIIDIINSGNQVSSLDCQTDEFSLYEVIGTSYDYDTKLDIENMMSQLSEEEKRLIYYRYTDDLTQSQTAHLLGMSQVQVSRNEKKILLKCKNNLVRQ